MRRREAGPAESPPHDNPPLPGIPRRSFLKGAGAGAAGLAAARLSLPAGAAEEQQSAERVLGPDPVPMTLHVNGQTYTARLEPRVTLADALREHLDLTGTKLICDRGTCGGGAGRLGHDPVAPGVGLGVTAPGEEMRAV